MLFKVKEMDRKFDFCMLAFIVILTAITAAKLSRIPNRMTLYAVELFMGALIVWLYYTIRAIRSLTYGIDKEGIRIHYGYKHILIPWEEVECVEFRSKMNLLKFMGNQWPGNYTGYFKEPGKSDLVVAYTTSKQAVIVIKSSGLKYVISPENPRGFLEEASKYQMETEHVKTQDIKSRTNLWGTVMGKRLIILNISVFIFIIVGIQAVAGGNAEFPMHYNLQGEVDRYGSAYEFYLALLGPAILLPIFLYISSKLQKAGIKEAASYLWIPLGFTIFMGLVILGMTFHPHFLINK